MSNREPRSIAELEAQVKNILTGDQSVFGEAAKALDATVEEARPHNLRHRIETVIKVVEGKRTDVVLMHATMIDGKDNEQVVVHPMVAAYYDRRTTLRHLDTELARADRAADWERAAAVAEAAIQVLEQCDGNQPSATDLPKIETGRLGRARPELEKRLEEAYRNATQNLRLAAACAGAAGTAQPV